MTETTPPSGSLDDASATQARRGFPVGAVIALLLLLAVAGWAAYVWITGGGDRFDIRRFALLGEYRPELYAVDGEVSFNGEPVARGNLEAQIVSGQGPERMLAPIKEGTFEFYSELNGRLAPGLPAGEYKVVLLVYEGGPGYSNTPVLPPEYYDFATTPITIAVSTDRGSNHFTIEETGELQSTTQEPAGRPAPPEDSEPADDKPPESPE